MAEAWAIIGIIANVTQFVGLGLQLFREGREIYKSAHGTKGEHRAAEVIVRDIQKLNEDAKATVAQCKEQGRSKDVQAIMPLAEECERLANRLLCVLEGLKVPEQTRFRPWVSFWKAFKSILKSDEMQSILTRLLTLESQLNDRVSGILQG
jgi:hypothetical protein